MTSAQNPPGKATSESDSREHFKHLKQPKEISSSCLCPPETGKGVFVISKILKRPSKKSNCEKSEKEEEVAATDQKAMQAQEMCFYC